MNCPSNLFDMPVTTYGGGGEALTTLDDVKNGSLQTYQDHSTDGRYNSHSSVALTAVSPAAAAAFSAAAAARGSCEPPIGCLSKEICFGCQQPIDDRFILKVMDNSWHERCLKCSVCMAPLRQSCFIKDRRLFCRIDYDRLYGVRCVGCGQPVLSQELVMRALGTVYHVGCFVCVVCRHQLQKGDQFVANDSQIYCRLDFEKKYAYMQLSPKSNDWYNNKSDDESSLDDNDGDHPKGPKRPRTILTTSQRRKFKASFEVNPKPCRKVRETLAAETGLSVRVVQVWFQNQRAKMKKLARRQNEESQGNEKGKKSTNNKNNKMRKDEEIESDSSVPPSESGSNLTSLVLCNDGSKQQTHPADSHLAMFNSHSQDLYSSNSLTPDALYGTTLTSLDDGRDVMDDLLHHHPSTASNMNSPGSTPGSGMILNPIDKLYSMHTSYFSVD